MTKARRREKGALTGTELLSPEKRLEEEGKVRLGEKKELLKSTHTLLSTDQNPTNAAVAERGAGGEGGAEGRRGAGGAGAVITKLKEQYPSPEGERARTLLRKCAGLEAGTRLMTATRTDFCSKFCLPWPSTARPSQLCNLPPLSACSISCPNQFFEPIL